MLRKIWSKNGKQFFKLHSFLKYFRASKIFGNYLSYKLDKNFKFHEKSPELLYIILYILYYFQDISKDFPTSLKLQNKSWIFFKYFSGTNGREIFLWPKIADCCVLLINGNFKKFLIKVLNFIIYCSI